MEKAVNHPNLSKMVKELAELMHEHSKKDPNFNIKSSSESKYLVAYTVLKIFLDEYDKLPRIITEAEYLGALNVVKEYTKQINMETDKFLKNSILSKTPNELVRHGFYNLNINVRVLNILLAQFNNVKLCDITKSEFMKARGGGNFGWNKFIEFTQGLIL